MSISGLLFLAWLPALVTAYLSFEVKLRHQCRELIAVDGGLTCGHWEQFGDVDRATHCFPTEATVTTKNGIKRMADLSKGEEILAFDHVSGQAVFSPVRAWLHRDMNAPASMVSVTSDAGTLIASAKHSLAVNGGTNYKFAEDLLPNGDSLMMTNGSGSLVRKITKVDTTGIFAPLTETSNFFVAGSDGSPGVLAHSFAHLEQPQHYEYAFQQCLNIAEFFWPSLHEVDESMPEPYYHPVARFWMWVLRVPTTEQLTRLIKAHTVLPPGSQALEDPESARRLGRGEGTARGRTARARRLGKGGGGAGGGNGESNNDQMLEVLLTAVLSLPPFLRHGLVPTGTPGYAAGPTNFTLYDGPLQAITTATWLEEAKGDNKKYLIISICVYTLGFCCFCCFSMLSKDDEDKEKKSGDEEMKPIQEDSLKTKVTPQAENAEDTAPLIEGQRVPEQKSGFRGFLQYVCTCGRPGPANPNSRTMIAVDPVQR